MKSILLASVAMVGFAGIAVADDHETTDGVSFSGTAEFGYNDTDRDGPASVTLDENGNIVSFDANDDDDKVGFYWESDLALTMARTLNNGLQAGVTFSIDVADDDLGGQGGGALSSSGFVLFLKSEDAGIYFGDTSFAAQKYWSDADVDEMAGDGFSEQDGEMVLRGDLTYGNVNASLSYTLADKNGIRPGSRLIETTNNEGDTKFTFVDGTEVDQLSIGASFEYAGYTFGVAYQSESNAYNTKTDDDVVLDEDVPTQGSPVEYSAYDDFTTDEILGIGALANIVGFDGGIAYANNMTQGHTSLGILVNYPIGAFAARAYYVLEDGPLSCDNPEDKPETDNIDESVTDQTCGIDNWGLGVTYEDGPISVEAIYKETEGDVDSKLEGTYDIGNGVMLWAGLVTGGDDYYLAGTVDLGGGAQLLVSYGVDDDDSEDDEIGNPAIQTGATVEVSLAF
jgi:outer membrane protein OmpU